MAQIIEITVTPAGTVKIDAQGFKGKGCEDATQQLELVLGGGQVKRDRKPDFYAAPLNSAQSIQRTF